MATSLQVSPDVSPIPGYNLNEKGGPLSVPWRLIGRALGANKMTQDSSGKYIPSNPGRDEIFNGGQVNNISSNLNAQQNQQATQQSRQLQLMKADTENQISMGNNVEANQAKLAQVNSAIAINQAQVAQGLGQATKAGVVAAPPVNPTPGMSLLASDVSGQNALNTGAQAIQTGQVLGSQPYADSVARNLIAGNDAQGYDNLAKMKLDVAGVGGVQPLPDGQSEIVAHGGSTQQSSSTPFVTTMGGIPYAIPGANTVTSSANETPAKVAIPINQNMKDQVTTGIGGVQDNQIPGTNISDEETSGPVSPTPSDSQTPKGSTKSAAFVQQPFVQSQAGIPTAPNKLDMSDLSNMVAAPYVNPTPDNQQSALQRFRNYLLMNPGMYR